MNDTRTLVLGCSLLLTAFALGCKGGGESADAGIVAAAGSIPVVNDARKDLVLTWFGDGGPSVASSVAEVPMEARREVRVQDPTIPPEARNPDVVFIADLTRSNPDGSYIVKATRRADFEKKRSKLSPAVPVPPSEAEATAAAGGTQIVMYATKHCPVCQNARRWLLDRGIPYVEKDVEENEANAKELAAKGQAQGVPTTGVPVFEIRGHLLPGFDPEAIQALLKGAALAPSAPPSQPSPQMQPMAPVPSGAAPSTAI
jgi:glutaredoxin